MTLNEFIDAKSDKPTFCSIKFNNNLFKGYYKNNEHTIWDETGSTCIYSWNDKLDVPVERLKQAMQYVINGFITCSQCLNKIDGKTEYFFAGRYCQKCWTDELERERNWAYSRLD